MLTGPTNPLHMQDLLKNILLNFPYATMIKFRQVCKFWKKMAEDIAPLLNSTTIKNAEEYMHDNSANPHLTGIEKLVTNYATLHPSDDSLDCLIIKFKSKFATETENGWEDTEPETQDLIPVKTVITFASKFGKHDIQYDKLTSREQRHAFLTAYSNLPNTTQFPRMEYLRGQSNASLARMAESLKRYTTEQYKGLLPEIEGLIKSRL